MTSKVHPTYIDEEKTMECPNCHQNNLPEAVYCARCGQGLNQGTSRRDQNPGFSHPTPAWVWLFIALIILGLITAVIILALRPSYTEIAKPGEVITNPNLMYPTPTPYVTSEILGSWSSSDPSLGLFLTFNLDGTLVISEGTGSDMIAHFEVIPPNTLHIIPPMGMGESDQYFTYSIEGDYMTWDYNGQMLTFNRVYFSE